MLGIKEAFKRIYTNSEDCLMKHSIFFFLTGIVSIFSVELNKLSEQKNVDPSNFGIIVAGLFLFIVLSFYIYGYNLNVMHNSFDLSKKDILPNFNLSHFKTFFKSLPLILVWGIYFILITLAGITIGAATEQGQAGAIVAMFITGLIGCALSICLQLVFVKYTKFFKLKGLFNIALPFKYAKLAFPNLCKLWGKFIPIIILNVILNVLANGSSLLAYIFTAIGAYVSGVAGFIYSFCIVQIFEEDIAPLEDIDY